MPGHSGRADTKGNFSGQKSGSSFKSSEKDTAQLAKSAVFKSINLRPERAEEENQMQKNIRLTRENCQLREEIGRLR